MSNVSHTQEYGDQSPLAAAVGGGWGLVLLIISASTSFLFYSTYVGDIFNFAPAVSWLLAGVIGVLLGEGGIVAWSYLRLNHAKTGKQLGLALAGFTISLIASAATTFVFLLLALSKTLLSNSLDATSIANLSLFGGVLIAIMAVVQLALFSYYGQASPQAEKKIAAANLWAMQFEAEQQIMWETARATSQQTIHEVRKKLPGNAQKQGAANAHQHEQEAFTYNGKPSGNGQVLTYVDLDNENRPT